MQSSDTASTAASTAASTTASPFRMNTNGPLLVRKRDVRPLDILVGRGHFKSPGNARYLRIVSQRQADYRSAKYADKERIAQEVLEVIYRPDCGEDDGGEGEGGENGANTNDDDKSNERRARFLQLEPDEDHRQPDSLWRVVTGKVVMDKVKMNLRQKSSKARSAAAATTPGTASASANAVPVPSLETSSSAAAAAMVAATGTSPATSSSQVAGNGGAAQGNGCPSSDRGSPSSSAAPPQTNRMQFLLQVLEVARTRMQTLCSKYPSDGTYGAGGADQYHRNMAQDLHQLGVELYHTLTREDSLLVWAGGDIARNSLMSVAGGGTTGTNIVAASTVDFESEHEGGDDEDDDDDEYRATKRRGGRRAPLIDFGYPSNVSFLVATLLRSISDFSEDDLVTVRELHEDLRLMLEAPDKYLVDIVSNDLGITGTLCIPPKLYGQERPMEILTNAFQSIFITRQNNRGLVLISGRAGSGKVRCLASISPASVYFYFTTCTSHFLQLPHRKCCCPIYFFAQPDFIGRISLSIAWKHARCSAKDFGQIQRSGHYSTND